MKKGLITRQISNQYQVYCDNNYYNCLAKGKLRLGLSPKVGDYVLFEQFEDVYSITEVLERKNELNRPNIANIDQAMIVMSSIEPNFSNKLLDRLITIIEYHNIQPIIVFSKMDLINNELDSEIIKYQSLGYQVILTGENYGNEELLECLANKITVLTGNSGVGKTSLLNRIDANFKLKTQVTSKALGRGKHTTRHCELFAVANGWLADTPGFSALDFSYLDINKIKQCFIEFDAYNCRYMDCLHENEPNCGVKEALVQEKIYQDRYDNYLEILKLIKGGKKR